MKEPKVGSSWRDSARSAKLWIFDASATFPLLVLAFHITWTTFIVAVVSMLFLSLLGRYGFSMVVFARWIRSSLAGKRKVAVPWWFQ
jgi:intracellular multiplication protein IcmT